MKVTEKNDKKITVSVRVNEYIIEKYRESEIPLSTVVEASMINFLKMEELDKIRFLADNIPENVETSSFKIFEGKWTDMIHKYITDMGLTQTVFSSVLKSASSIGAITLIGAALNLSSKFIENGKMRR